MIAAVTRDGKKVSIVAVTGPSSYTAGGFAVAVGDLRTVLAVLSASASGGYAVEVAGVSGNTVTLKVYHYNYPATSAGPAVEVSAGTNLSGVLFTVVALGL